MTVKIFHHQYRTAEQTYLFQSKDEKTLTLKVYDLSRSRLSKASVELTPSQIETLFKAPKVLSLLNHFQKSLPAAPTLFEDISEEFRKVINLLKFQVPLENAHADSFTCPITYEVFKDPVMDNCGHTFEKDAIEKSLKTKNTCPLSGEPITILTPNLHIRQALEAWQTQDPIPTFKLFKKDSTALATGQLKMAQTYIQEELYEEALNAYNQAFQFTQRWEDYQSLITLFQKMNMPEKAQLATLYLAKYQLEANDTEKALQTLEELLSKKNHYIDIPIRILLVHLYMTQKKLPEALSLALTTAKLCEQTHSQQAILLYNYILHAEPTSWKVYDTLATLIQSPQEKAHLFLKGACHAIEAGNSLAANFCRKAEKELPYPFIDRLVQLELLNTNRPQLIQELIALAQNYETAKDAKQTKQVNKYLTSFGQDVVHGYYEAAALALLQGDFKTLEQTINKLLQIDPTLQHLDTVQKVQILTQKHLCDLSGKLKETTSKLKETTEALQSTQTEVEKLKEAEKLREIERQKEAEKLREIKRQKEAEKLREIERQKEIEKQLLQIPSGKAKWEILFGDVGVEPPLPANIFQILQGPCPIWPGKTVQETHLLVLIPATVNGQPFTLETLEELVHKPKTGRVMKHQPFTLETLEELVQKPKTGRGMKYCRFILGEYKDPPVNQSYWTLISQDVIEGSQNKSYAQQQQLVADLAQKTGIAYSVPKALEAATAILMHRVSTNLTHQVSTKKRIYADIQDTYTRCQERYNEKYQLAAGGFSSGNLYVSSPYSQDHHGSVGVGVARKFL